MRKLSQMVMLGGGFCTRRGFKASLQRPSAHLLTLWDTVEGAREAILQSLQGQSAYCGGMLARVTASYQIPFLA